MVPAVLLAAGASQLIVGVWALVAPRSFYDAIATFPPYNDHFLKDVGSWNLALGLAAVIAARTPSWQRGMLAVMTLQFALHTLSHAIDAGDADPGSKGVGTLVALALGTLVLGAVLVRAEAGDRERTAAAR